MLEDGYAAVSSRRVGRQAGLKSQLLHYYFGTMDDLFIAVFQRLNERFHERFAHAVTSGQPLMALWKLSNDPASTALLLEFVALATHRKAVRTLLARSTRRTRSVEVAALTRIMERSGITSDDPSPRVLALLIASVAHKLITEKALGVSDGHAEIAAFVERHLEQVETPPGRRVSRAHRLPENGVSNEGRTKPRPAPGRSGKPAHVR